MGVGMLAQGVNSMIGLAGTPRLDGGSGVLRIDALRSQKSPQKEKANAFPALRCLMGCDGHRQQLPVFGYGAVHAGTKEVALVKMLPVVRQSHGFPALGRIQA